VWVGTRAFYPLVAFLAVRYMPKYGNPTSVWPWYDLWTRFDGVRYLEIATQGYSARYLGPAGWFPGYPLLTKLLQPFFPPAVAAVLVSNLCFLGALFCLYHLFRMDLDERQTRLSLLFVALFPTAFLSTCLYSESTFLLFTSACYLSFRKGWTKTALLLAGCAALTRPVGVVLLPCLLWERSRSGKLRKSGILLYSTAVLLPVAAFFCFLWVKVGDPLSYLHIQSSLSDNLAVGGFLSTGRELLWEHKVGLAFLALAMILVTVQWAWMRGGYRILSLGLLLMGFMHLQGGCMHRFMWVAFPLFRSLEPRLGKNGFRLALFLSYLLQLALFALWVQGYRTTY
jgi:hypothetical protein